MAQISYKRIIFTTILAAFFSVAVSGAPSPSSSLLSSSSSEPEESLDEPAYQQHPSPPLYRYQSYRSYRPYPSYQQEDEMNSIYSSQIEQKSQPSRQVLEQLLQRSPSLHILDKPRLSEDKSIKDKSEELGEMLDVVPSSIPPFAPELEEDTKRYRIQFGLAPMSLLDQLAPTLW